MKCSHCQNDNPEGSSFCLQCGSPAEWPCPKCGHTLPRTAQFCNSCGYGPQGPYLASFNHFNTRSYTPPLLSEKILTSRSVIEGELKVVTVLFADVAHYTGIASLLKAENVHEVLDGCFKILMKEIHKYEGTVNQFTGDGVMALFGAPFTQEDHAQRACRAALAIQQALEPYANKVQDDFGINFQMRIGLNSGPAVVGAIGDRLRMDYTAIGDTTNIAYRLQSVAEAGTIYASEQTYQLSQGDFNFEALDKQKLKGIPELVSIYRLLSLRPEKPRTIYAKMVGRNEELIKLELQLLKAVDGQGSVVSIIGEAGIGKSRLVRELKDRETMKHATLLEGRAISIGRNLSYHPIVDLLKHWMRIRDDDDAETAFGKLRQAIKIPVPDGTDELIPFIATLMGIPLWGKNAEMVRELEGEVLEKKIQNSVKDLIIKATKQSTLLIVMEDLHWADASSLDLLEYLFTMASEHRVLFVNLFRPDIPDTGGRILKYLQECPTLNHVEITLDRLDKKDSEALIENMLALW